MSHKSDVYIHEFSELSRTRVAVSPLKCAIQGYELVEDSASQNAKWPWNRIDENRTSESRPRPFCARLHDERLIFIQC